ncbi:hypothetical protein [Nocardia brevicatena]|uniref:hypothetical protein n=1 Tax=Nocardia brevicatena TaxID=37327 RepID=UPI0012FC027A|nr:hypothetical protein [Nocardia brevicatena]
MTLRGPGFESGHQRPQFVDRFDGVPGLAGDFGQAHGAVSGLEHGPELGIIHAGDTQNVRRQAEPPGDMAAGGYVTDCPAPGLDHRHVRLVVAEHIRQRGLVHAVYATVGAKDGR